MKNIHAYFEQEQYYHVFNRTNNKEVLFRNNENRSYFMRLITKRLLGFVKFYAYALLDNHFHFIISVCSEKVVIHRINNIPTKDRKISENNYLKSASQDKDTHKLIATQWSRVFNGYTQSINKRYNRKGHLFHSPFKRNAINFESKFSFLIYYIHHNSRKHGLVKNFLFDNWHSYNELLENHETFLERDYVIDWFGGKDNFIAFHQGKYLEKDFSDIWIE